MRSERIFRGRARFFLAVFAGVLTLAASRFSEAQILIASDLGNRWDWLYGADPLMLEASQATSTEIAVWSDPHVASPYSGQVHVRVECCVDSIFRQPAAGLSATFMTTTTLCLRTKGGSLVCHPVSLPVPGFDGNVDIWTAARGNLRVTTSSTAALGQYIATVYADSPSGTNKKEVWVNVVPPSLPADGAAPSCVPGVEVASLMSITPDTFAWKRAHAAQTTYSVGVAFPDNIRGLDMTFQDPFTSTGPLRPDVTEITFTNNWSFPVRVRTSDSRNCSAAGSSHDVQPNQTVSFSFASNAFIPGAITATTLVFGKTCGGWDLFTCWDPSRIDDFAALSEGPFWTLFGGRRVVMSTVGVWGP